MKEDIDYWELLKLTIAEQRHFVDDLHNRFTFTIKIVVSIIGAILLGIFKVDQWYHTLFLFFGPVFLYVFCDIGHQHVMRMHRSILEVITTRIKLEQMLGFCNPLEYPENAQNIVWRGEPIIPTRHLKARKMENISSSEEFIAANPSGGDVRIFKNVFLTLKVMSGALGIGILLIAAYQSGFIG